MPNSEKSDGDRSGSDTPKTPPTLNSYDPLAVTLSICQVALALFVGTNAAHGRYSSAALCAIVVVFFEILKWSLRWFARHER